RERYATVGELARAFEGLIATHGPESAATMAFPMSPEWAAPGEAKVADPKSDYPPPPPPMNPNAVPPATPPPPPAPQPRAPFAVQQVYAAPADSYGGTSVPARMGEAFQTQHTAASARSLEANGARAPASTKVVPILVAFVAVLLVSGAIAAIVVLGKKS